MNDYVITKEELFGPVYTVDFSKPKKKRRKEKIRTSCDEIINQLEQVRSATAFADLVLEIARTAREKKINIYVYRCNKGGRYKHKTYYGIYAVPSGIQRSTQRRTLPSIISAIDEYPDQVNCHKNSKQYRLLQMFLKDISEYTA